MDAQKLKDLRDKLSENATISVERVEQNIKDMDLQDLCDATDAAIESGGGFGWLNLPPRDVLERYWQGVAVMPARILLVARLDGTICGTAQLIMHPKNNQAQSFALHLTSHFVTPWARKYGVASSILKYAETIARGDGFEVINLDVRETQTAAISLYESHGYQRIGTHPFYAKVEGCFVQGFYYMKKL
jgi:ribosomal protein S18 acetylase RimI-like enzyme